MIVTVIASASGNVLKVESDATANATIEYFPLADISNIYPNWAPAPSAGVFGSGWPDIYPYQTRTELVIYFTDSSKSPLKIELQKITGAGIFSAFNTGTKANLDAAAAALAALL